MKRLKEQIALAGRDRWSVADVSWRLRLGSSLVFHLALSVWGHVMLFLLRLLRVAVPLGVLVYYRG